VLVRSWRNLTNLRSLDVGNNQLVHADDVLDLLSSLPNLKHIRAFSIAP
jgi:Leucine-rich repeat (LRR) protein